MEDNRQNIPDGEVEDLFNEAEGAEAANAAEPQADAEDISFSGAEEAYIAEVEAQASRIISNAKNAAEKLKQEVLEEIAQMKSDAEERCRDAEDRVNMLMRDAEETSEAADARFMEAKEASDKARAAAEAESAHITEAARAEAQEILADAKAEAEETVFAAQAEAEEIIAAARAEAEDIRLRANLMLVEAKNARPVSTDSEPLSAEASEYFKTMEKHAQVRLDMISELLKSEQEWAYRARQNADRVNRALEEIRAKYEEDFPLH